MRKIILTGAILSTFFAQAQQGIGTDTPAKSSVLDLQSSKRGLLIPRIDLVATDQASPVTSPANSLLVYNKATAGAGDTKVTPGYYYWEGNKWVRLIDGDSQNEYTAGAGMNLNGNEFSRDGLEKITESGKIGWRLIGQDPAKYGDIGARGIDFSIFGADAEDSDTRGATGSVSFALGYQTTASGAASFASGLNTIASGSRAASFGDETEASGGASAAFGRYTKAETTYSMVIGFGNTLTSRTTGFYNPGANRRSFVIGNGTAVVNNGTIEGVQERSDAFTVLTNGKVGIDIDNFEKDYAEESNPSIGNISYAKLQVNGLIQSRGILEADGPNASKVVVANSDGVLRTRNISDVLSTGLEKITENNKSGWRFIGRNPANYGDIGTNAVDLSTSYEASDVNGATGNHSVAMGSGTIASGAIALAAGQKTSASGDVAFAMGFHVNATNESESVFGAYNTDNQNVSQEVFITGNYRLFGIGNGYKNPGDEDANKSDAFMVLTNGKVGIDIDNFENTNSDAKLQVNGKTLIGNFGDNNTNNNTINAAGNAKAQLDVRGDVAISTIADDNNATYMLVEGAEGVVKRKSIASITNISANSKAYPIESGTHNVTDFQDYNPGLEKVMINATIRTGHVVINLPQANAANLGQTIDVKVMNSEEPSGPEEVRIYSSTGTELYYGQMPYQSWILRSDGHTWEKI